MSTMRAIKQSQVARLGTYGLIVLWYVIFTLGTLLEVGFAGLTSQTSLVRIGAASVLFILALGFVRWFFETKAG